MNIAETLRERASQLGDTTALTDVYRGRDRSYNFFDFDQATVGVAGQLEAAGLTQGDGVLLLHPVTIELYLVLVALFRLGCVAIFLDPSAGRTHVERCCAILPPKAFFGTRRAHLLRLAIPALRRVPHAFCTEWVPGTMRIDPHRQMRSVDPLVPLADDASALVTFTSGSTGQPKAAMRTHGFLLAQHRVLQQSLGLRPGGCDLTTLPIFVLANLGSGVASVLPHVDLRFPGAIHPEPVIAQIRRHGVKSMVASPAFMSRILGACEKKGSPIKELQRVYLGGAPVFPGVLRKTKQFCPRATITAVYGSTEAEPMADIALEDISPDDFLLMQKGQGLLAGKPVPCISLRVIRDQWGKPMASLNSRQFEQLAVAAGQAGEIVVSGAHVLPGYLNAEGDVETKFDVDGTRWHRTGDLGYLDPNGRLWLLARCSARIHDGRGTLYPLAVECAAMERPFVRRAALVSVSGRRVLAVEAEEPTSPEEIQRSLAWAELDQVVTLERIPVDRRHNGKIDYALLARQLASASPSA